MSEASISDLVEEITTLRGQRHEALKSVNERDLIIRHHQQYLMSMANGENDFTDAAFHLEQLLNGTPEAVVVDGVATVTPNASTGLFTASGLMPNAPTRNPEV